MKRCEENYEKTKKEEADKYREKMEKKEERFVENYLKNKEELNQFYDQLGNRILKKYVALVFINNNNF